MGDTQDRLDQYLATKSVGASDRTATIGAFPEYSPEAMMAQIPEMVRPPMNAPVNELSGIKASEEISRPGMVKHFMAQGLDEMQANRLFKEVFTGLPEVEQPADYDRLDKVLSSGRSSGAAQDVEHVSEMGDIISDIEFAGAALQGAFGGFQQGLFGVLIGEKAGNVVDRLWPDVDIRDEEGVMQSKAVVPLATRAAALGTLKLAIKSLTFGKVGVPDKIDKVLAEDKAALVETDYLEGLLTGSEVIEYWMNDDNIVGTRLPDRNTPEREEYDQLVRDNAAQAYNEVMDTPFGTRALMGIATGGALLDVFADPVVLISEIPVKGLEVARRLAPASSRARVTAAVADRTRRLPEVMEAVANAEKWVDTSRAKVKAKPTKANKDQLQHAEKMLVRMKNRAAVESFPGEQVLLRTHPRLDPDHAKLVGREYLGADPKARRHVTESFIKKQIDDLEVATVDKWNEIVDEIDTAIDAGDDALVANLEEQLRLLQKPADEWRNTATWFRERMKAEKGSRTAAFFKENINKQQPYQAEQLSVPVKGGKGFKEEVPESALDAVLTEGEAAHGPHISFSYDRKIDKIARLVSRGAPAEDIMEVLEEFAALRTLEEDLRLPPGLDVDNADFGDPKVLSKILAHRSLTDEADIAAKLRKGRSKKATEAGTLDPLDDPAYLRLKHKNEWRDRWAAVESNNAMSFLAKELVESFATGSSKVQMVMDEIITMVFDSVPPRPRGTPLKANVENAGKFLDDAGKGAGKPPPTDTPWESFIARVKAEGDKAEAVPFSKKQALKAVQDNIKRAVAQGAPESEIIQWEKTFSDIQNDAVDLSSNLPRSKVNSDDVVKADMAEHRYNSLSQSQAPVMEPHAPQRFEFGPDATESASEAARILAGGGDIDDIMFHGSGVELFNTSYAARLTSSSGTGVRSAEALGSTVKRKVKVRGEDGKVRTKVITERGPSAGEAEWLGVNPVKTQVEAAQWQQSLGEKMGDIYTRGLYPESFMPRAAWFMQARREVMRTMQSANPQMYSRMHDAVHAQEYEMIRMAEFFSKELNVLGVYKKVKGTDVLDPAQSQRFFKILNLDPSGDDYSTAIATLSGTERRSLRRVRQELDFAKQKLGLDETPLTIEGYIDHVFDPRWFDSGARSPQWQGYSPKAEVFNRHMLPRAGNAGYTEDLALALDNYTRAFSRKLHLEPLFEDMKFDAGRWVRENPGQTWYADYTDDIINGMQGKPSTAGQRVDRDMASLNARIRSMDSANLLAKGVGKVQKNVVGPATEAAGSQLAKLPGKVGKLGGAMQSEGVRITEFGSTMSVAGFPRYATGDVSRTALGVSALSYTSVLGGSGRYFPMAISTGMATTGSRFGVFESLRGILTMSTAGGRKLAKQVGLEKQWVTIMDDAAWTKMGSLAAHMPSFNGGTVLGPSISATENTIRGWTFHAAIGDMLRKSEFESWDDVLAAGMGNAFVHEGLRTTEEVNHLFGAFGKNPAMHSVSKSGNTAATQFLSFIPKQTEELLAQTLKNPGRIGQYMMISGYLQRTAAKAGLDISEYVGMGFLPKTPDEATSIATEAAVSFVTHAFEMGKLQAGYGDKVAAQRAGEDVRRAFTNFIPLAMATQRAGRSLETLRTGALFSSGRKVRDVDLGDFEWDSSKGIADNLSNLPAGFGSSSSTAATEMLGVLSGMDTVAGTLEREQYMKLRTQSKERMFRRMQIADALSAAVKGEDGAAFDTQMGLAIEEGMFLPELTKTMDRATLELVLPRLLRMQMMSDQMILDGIDAEQRARTLYEFRFNR